MLHDMQMGAYVVLCPNIVCNHSAAARAPFEKRHYFFCEELVNPADAAAVKAMLDWREKLAPPARPRGWHRDHRQRSRRLPGPRTRTLSISSLQHRKMLDRVRPGIELIYWMHAGWRGWSHLYEVGKISFSTPEEQEDVLRRLIASNPEPWGLANGLDYAEDWVWPDRVITSTTAGSKANRRSQ